VLAYSYGQASSRDVRYGQQLARRLGFRHVAIPTPRDFVVHAIAEDAWRFDAEWSSELHWAVRFAYRDRCLGETSGYRVLSGMYGDVILGSDRFHYRRKLGEAPLNLEGLSDAFFLTLQEYGTVDSALELFEGDHGPLARKSLDGIVNTMLTPYVRLPPFLAMLRAEFEQRQRRHTAMVAQVIERDRQVMTPFLDNEVVDFALRIPYESLHGRKLYQRMIVNHLPHVAAIPYSGSGLPLSPAPLPQSVHWRWQKLLHRVPRLERRLTRRNALFNFHDGVLAAQNFFQQEQDCLRELEPIVNAERTAARYQALICGQRTPVDQACALLPPALFMRELRRRLAETGYRAPITDATG